METVKKARASRKKVAIEGQQPTKEYLSSREAAAFLDISTDTLAELAKKYGIPAAPLFEGGKLLYYKVADLNAHLRRMALIK